MENDFLERFMALPAEVKAEVERYFEAALSAAEEHYKAESCRKSA